LRILFANEAQQADLIHMAQALAFAQFGSAIERLSGNVRAGMIQPYAEEEALWQRLLSARLTQIVDRRQQQLGHLLAVGVDVFQIAAQHVQGIAERRQLHVAFLTGTGGNVCRLVEHFLSQ
jgi:very-short-patch-repair endonuclease